MIFFHRAKEGGRFGFGITQREDRHGFTVIVAIPVWAWYQHYEALESGDLMRGWRVWMAGFRLRFRMFPKPNKLFFYPIYGPVTAGTQVCVKTLEEKLEAVKRVNLPNTG